MTTDDKPTPIEAAVARKTVAIAGRKLYDIDLDFLRGLLPPFARKFDIEQPGPFRAVLAAGMRMERALNALDIDFDREVAGTFADGSGI